MAEEGQTDVPSVDSPGESTSSPPSPKLSPVSPASIPPSAPSEGYRELILKRMHERNLKSRQFESVYKSCKEFFNCQISLQITPLTLFFSVEFVVDQLQRQRRQRVTRTESVGCVISVYSFLTDSFTIVLLSHG